MYSHLCLPAQMAWCSGDSFFDITIWCFLHLEELYKQNFFPPLPHPIRLWPLHPTLHMQSRAPRLEGGKAIFQVNQQGCHSSELFGAAEEGTALEAGSSLVMRFSSPSPPTEVWSVVLARGICPPPCSEAGDSGLRGSPTSCSCIKSCHDSQGTSPTSSSTGPHPAMLAVLVKCLTGALPLDSTNYTVSSLTTRTMSHAPFTPSTVPDIKKILLCVAQHCPTH